MIGARVVPGSFYRMRNRLLFVVLIAATPVHAQRATLAQVGWLEGCWELNAANRRVVERWTSADVMLVGSSRTWIGGQPRESEALRLFTRGDTLVYEALPSGQQRTEFKTVVASDREVVFANPAHDFPQRIVYTRVGSDSVIARIEGDRAGRRAPVSYPFRKVVCTPDTPTASEVARAELAPMYTNLVERETATAGGMGTWMSAHAAPGFVYVLWLSQGPVPASAGAEQMARAAEASERAAVSQNLRDRAYEHTIDRVFARGDTATVLVVERRSWKFPDTAGRFGAAGDYRERVTTERRLDRWVRISGQWKLAEAALVGSEQQIEGKVTARDGRAVSP